MNKKMTTSTNKISINTNSVKKKDSKSIFSISNNSLGSIRTVLSEHMISTELEKEEARLLKQSIVSLGQGGGRMGAEMARMNNVTFMFNTSKSDMAEHAGLIPEKRRFVTSSKLHPRMEGTDKNARLGYEIALENKDIYKSVALQKEIVEAEFVWTTVSLGGGTGNGALKVALHYLSQVRAKHSLADGKIPLGVICSIPSKAERGSAFRRNALAGLAVLQEFISQGKIGMVIVIDNEKLATFYNDYFVQNNKGQGIDSRTYTNISVAATLAEICSLTLMNGRSVYDKTELLNTLSTPGWGTISKREILLGANTLNDTIDYQSEVETLFKDDQVLADYDFEGSRDSDSDNLTDPDSDNLTDPDSDNLTDPDSDNLIDPNSDNSIDAITGVLGIIFPSNKNIAPSISDRIYSIASDMLNTKVNLSVSKSDSLKDKLLLYGVTVVSNPPKRLAELAEELEQWEIIEKEREQKKHVASSALAGFGDFFTNEIKTKPVSSILEISDLDDLPGDDGIEEKENDLNRIAPKMSLSDLEDL